MRRFHSLLRKGRKKSPAAENSGKEDNPATSSGDPQREGFIDFNPDYKEQAQNCDESFNVDIVAIHGLNGDYLNSWIDRESGKLWLRDSLPEDLPGARVFSFGYSASLLFDQSKTTFLDFADSLLMELRTAREQVKRRRPLIFVAHSLGGIVCKQALINAQQDSRYNVILEDTIGILFFGTPHRGSGLSHAGNYAIEFFNTLLKISTVRLFTGKIRDDLVKGLEPLSTNLEHINRGFPHLLDKFEVIALYETKGTKALAGKLVVEKTSAIWGHGNEERIPINRDHQTINRLVKGRTDYTNVVTRLQMMSREACQKASLSDSTRDMVMRLQTIDISVYRSNLPPAADGTCRWLLRHPQYQSWYNETRSSLLWISGHPGSGKTVLASFITQDFGKSQVDGKHEATVCYFFCNENIDGQSDAVSILRSLIFQILLERRSLLTYLKTAVAKVLGINELINNFSQLWELFRNIAHDKDVGNVYFFIDAIDECKQGPRKKLLENIAEIVDKVRLAASHVIKFFVTSRPDIRLREYVPDNLCYHVSLEETKKELDQDISMFVGQRVERLAKRLHAKDKTVESMQQSLLQSADRTFLWVSFILEIMDEELRATPDDFTRLLNDLPNDLEALYETLLRRIPAQKYGSAMKVLEAIISSPRPLRCEEINIILTVSEAPASGLKDMSALTEKRSTYIQRDLRGMLGSLLRISDDTVYLVHISLKEFLCSAPPQHTDIDIVRDQHIDLQRANFLMAKACADFLSFDDFASDLFSTACSSLAEESSTNEHQDQMTPDEEGSFVGLGSFFATALPETEEAIAEKCNRLVNRYGLFDYASMNWAKHYALSQALSTQQTQQIFVGLLDREASPRFENWYKYYYYIKGSQHLLPQAPTNLVSVCYFGLSDMLQNLLQDAAVSESDLWTGLFWAAREGHALIVCQILRTTVEPDSRTYENQTPLCAAAGFGHLEVVKLLAADRRVDVNYRATSSIAALSQAAEGGHLAVAEYLLAQPRIDVCVESSRKRTPLFHAIVSRDKALVRRMLEEPLTDVNHVDSSGCSPIIVAAMEGDVDIVRILRKVSKIELDRSDNKGRTAFSHAAGLGHLQVVRELRKCRSTAAKDNKGRNAYSWAAFSGHVSVIEEMMKYQIEGVDEPDNDDWTPLLWALDSSNFDTMVTFMRRKDVNINHGDHNGRTMLDWSPQYGKEDMLRTWLAKEGREAIAHTS